MATSCFVVHVTLTIDGLDLPERVLRVSASSSAVALNYGVREAIKLALCPEYSTRITDITARVRPGLG